jgi:hypothetical protein
VGCQGSCGGSAKHGPAGSRCKTWTACDASIWALMQISKVRPRCEPGLASTSATSANGTDTQAALQHASASCATYVQDVVQCPAHGPRPPVDLRHVQEALCGRLPRQLLQRLAAEGRGLAVQRLVQALAELLGAPAEEHRWEGSGPACMPPHTRHMPPAYVLDGVSQAAVQKKQQHSRQCSASAAS